MSRAGPPDPDEWRTYEEFAAGIGTFRLPNVDLVGVDVSLTLDGGTSIALAFGSDTVTWQAAGSLSVPSGTRDPYDAVAVRDGVFFVNLPRTSADREALTIVYSTRTNRRSGRPVDNRSAGHRRGPSGSPDLPRRHIGIGAADRTDPRSVPGPDR